MLDDLGLDIGADEYQKIWSVLDKDNQGWIAMELIMQETMAYIEVARDADHAIEIMLMDIFDSEIEEPS